MGEEAFSEVRDPPGTAAAGARGSGLAWLSGSRPQEGHEALALGPQEHRRPREERGFYQAYGPPETTVEELLGVCQERWAVEECFAEAKGEVVGLDHYYEVRRWDAWHRHVTLCLLAHAFLVVTRRAAAEEEASPKKGISISS